MSEFGSLDDRQYQRFVEKIGNEVRAQSMLRRVTKRTNIIADYAMRQIVNGTPVKTGTLRRAWSRSDVQYADHAVTVKISNDQNYASFVEYGHRTRGGKSWVEGRFMAKKGLEKTQEKKLNKTAQAELDGYISKLLG
jgi:hypothetical protein